MVTYEDMQREKLQNDPEEMSLELCRMQCRGEGLTPEYDALKERMENAIEYRNNQASIADEWHNYRNY